MTKAAGGRPRDPAIDAAVQTATLRLLGERGYGPLSIGEIARVAGVPRPAIYRRWPTKRHLVIDVLADTIGLRPTPDTGDLRRDLIKGIDTIRVAVSKNRIGPVLAALVADLGEDAELHRDFLERIFTARRATTERTLRAAIERGEVRADIDMPFVLDALAAPIYYRALFRHAPVTRKLVEQTVDGVLAMIRSPRVTTLKP